MGAPIDSDENEQHGKSTAKLIKGVESKTKTPRPPILCYGLDEADPHRGLDRVSNRREVGNSTTQPVHNSTYRKVPEKSMDSGACDENDENDKNKSERDGLIEIEKPVFGNRSVTNEDHEEHNEKHNYHPPNDESKPQRDRRLINLTTPVRPSAQSILKVGSAASSSSPAVSDASSVFSTNSVSDTPFTPPSPLSSRKQSTSYFGGRDTSPSARQAQIDARSDIGQSFDDEQTEEPALESSLANKGGDGVARKLSFPVKEKISFERLPNPATKSKIWSIIEKSFGTKEKEKGIVYILQLDDRDVFKIGYTSNSVYVRYQSEWCFDGAVLVAESQSPFRGAYRVEQLTHADLFESRRRQKKCLLKNCETLHAEWFHTTLEDVMDTVERWTRFVKHEQAYVNDELSANAKSSLWGLWTPDVIVGKLESDWGTARPEKLKVFEVGVPRSEFKNVGKKKVKAFATVPVAVDSATLGIDKKLVVRGEGDSKLREELVVENGEGAANEQETGVLGAEQPERQVEERSEKQVGEKMAEKVEDMVEEEVEERVEERVEHKLEDKTEHGQSTQEATNTETRNGNKSADQGHQMAPGAPRKWAEALKLLTAWLCFDDEFERWIFWSVIFMDLAFIAIVM